MRLYLQSAMTRTPEDIQDELLVLQCQQGDREALRSLITRWQPRLCRLAWRLTGERETARDVVQDAWMAIMRGLGRLDDPARFRPWAYRVVSNKCADWTRRRVVQRKVTQTLEREAASTQADAPDETDSANELARLRDALAKLPEQQRAALSLYYLEGMSVSDIARVLSIAKGTVKSHLFNARGCLNKTLERVET